jgi:hypothetical protein
VHTVRDEVPRTHLENLLAGPTIRV